MTTKTILMIASAVGALISAVLLIMDELTGHALVWMDWQMPGISAAVLYWGAFGSSTVAGLAVCLVVNAIVYGAAAFAVLVGIRMVALPLAK